MSSSDKRVQTYAKMLNLRPMKALLTRLLPSASLFCLSLTGIVPFAAGQQCTSFGDPVVNITFGSGSNPGPSLEAATTSYNYVSMDCPQDGYYTVRNSTYNCNGSTWHNLPSDHTGDPNGYFMLVNCSYTPSDFYLDTVKGLCPNTTYQFAAWITNILKPDACNGAGIRPNITFSIEPITGGPALAKINSGDIPTSAAPVWTQYGLAFTTPNGVTEIVLRMTNNAPGGCGNDLALDDITFRPCSSKVQTGISGAGASDTARFCIDGQTPLTFNGISAGGYNMPRYQWQISLDTGRTWNDLAGETTVNYTRQPSAATGYYQYRQLVGEGSNITLPSCRVSSNVITVQVNPKPMPAAFNDGPKCEGDSLTLKASGGAIYNWTGPGGFMASGQTVVLRNVSPAEAGGYHVLVTNGYGCTQTDVTTALVYPRPIAQFTPGSPPCELASLSFTDQSSAAGQTLTGWKWYWGDGDSSVVQAPTHTYKDPGNYPVGLIVTSDKGCSSLIQTTTLVIHALPHPDFSLPKVCIADPQAVFSDNSTIPDGTGSSFSYRWDFGEPASGTANTSTQKNGTHKYQTAGPYPVRLQVTSGAGCIKDTTKTLTVNGDNPLAHFSIADASLLCSNQPVTLTDGSSVSPGSIIRVQVYWDYQHDPTIDTIDENPSAGTRYSHNYPAFSSPASEDYRIHYVVWSGENCMAQIDQPITVKASPRTQFDALNNVCEGTPFFPLTGGRETEGFAGVGAYSGRAVSRLGFFNPHQAGPGLDTIYYTFTADNGCYSTSAQSILVYPQPRADAGPTQYILQGDVGVLEGSGAGNNISFSWDPADSILGDSHVPHPRVSPQNDLVYMLKVTSADGCLDSSQVQVIVLKLPVVPNAFSPNGDGINDTWVIRYLNEYPQADVQVFNRWGQPVYHVTGYTTPWDGTYKGQPLPIGTYYWIIRPGNGRRQMAGSVTILR